jgi:HAD superfamily hydrolase (TIGR01509 family)
VVEAVIFDMDGLLIDSEGAWDQVRREYVAERGGAWKDEATRAMMGMSSPEWSRYVAEELGVDLPPMRINEEVAARVGERYERELPLLPGAVEAVERIGGRWPLGLASSSNRELINRVLDLAGIAERFEATVSSEEVSRGKPSPDVYLKCASMLDRNPTVCAAIEDSHNGILSASSAGLKVVAVPNAEFPPDDEALSKAEMVLPGLDRLTVEAIEDLPG